jgi:hypothetical protein
MILIPNFSVDLSIHDVIYVSYLVPESRVRALIPANLDPAIVSDGNIFVSVVALRNKYVRLSGLPFINFSYNQINLRTYVLDPETRKIGVFFLRSGITSKLIAVFTDLLKIPWEHIRFDIKASKDDKGRYVKYTVTGTWGEEICIEAQEETQEAKSIHTFENQGKVIEYITGGTIGFFTVPGELLRFEVEHSVIEPRFGKVSHINLPIFTSSGILTEEEILTPHNVLLAHSGKFRVFLPPEHTKLPTSHRRTF